jgi:hypothetical protein
MPKNKLHQVDFKAGLLNRKFQNFPEHPVYKSGLSLVENFEFIDDQGLSARRSTRLLGLPTDLKGFKNWLYDQTGTLVGDEYEPLSGFEYHLEQVFPYNRKDVVMLFKNSYNQPFLVFIDWLEDSEKYQVRWKDYPARYRNPGVIAEAEYSVSGSHDWAGVAVSSPTYPQISGTSVEVRPTAKPIWDTIRMFRDLKSRDDYLVVYGRFIQVVDRDKIMEGDSLIGGQIQDRSYVIGDVDGDFFEFLPHVESSKVSYHGPAISPVASVRQHDLASPASYSGVAAFDATDPLTTNANARQMWIAEPWNIDKTYNKGDIVSLRVVVGATTADITTNHGAIINFKIPDDNYDKIPGLGTSFVRDNMTFVSGAYYTMTENTDVRLYMEDRDLGGKYPTLFYFGSDPEQFIEGRATDTYTTFVQACSSGDNLLLEGEYRSSDPGLLQQDKIPVIKEIDDFVYFQDRMIVIDETRILISRVGWYWDFFDSTDPDGGMAIHYDEEELPVWIADTAYGLICGTTKAEYLLLPPGSGLTTTNIQNVKISSFGSPKPNEPGVYEYNFSYGGGFYFLSKKGLARLVYSQEKQSYDVAIYDLFSDRIVGPMKKVVKDMEAGYVYIQDQEGIKALNFEGGPFANGYDFELDSTTFEGNGYDGAVDLFDFYGRPGFLAKGFDQNRPIAFVLEDMNDLPIRCDLIIPETRGQNLSADNVAGQGKIYDTSYDGSDSDYKARDFIRYTYLAEDKGIVKTDNGDGTTRVDLPDIGLRYDVDASTLGMDANTDWTLKDGAEIILFSTDADLTEVKIHGTYTDDRKTYDVEHPNVTFLTQTTDWNDGLGLFWVGFNFTSRFKTVPALNLPGTSTTGGKVWIQLFDTLGGKILANDKSYELPLTTEEIAGEEFTGRKSKRVDVSHTEEGIKLGFEAADFRRAHINSLSVEAEIQEDK